ncbi:MAG: hypothetical protein JST07_00865 [Bacteroidetes bacterium]|nr:hypothetical protein [Bacteroidota bacterium]
MKKAFILSILLLVTSFLLFAQTKKIATNASGANSIALKTSPLPQPKEGEVKILELNGVSIFIKQGSSIHSAIISRVVNSNNRDVVLSINHIDGGNDVNSGGRFSLHSMSSTEGCAICYCGIKASTSYDKTNDDKNHSIGQEFGVENINVVKVVGAQVKVE